LVFAAHWRSLPASLVVLALLPSLVLRGESELAAALRTPGALQSRVRFDHITTADGLSHDSVFSILEDRNGFLWFGTQGGLNRYDGREVTQFRHDPRNPNSIGDDFVQFLFEDSRGGIWTGPGGLSRFDPHTQTFTRFVVPGDEIVQSIGEDGAGFLWIGAVGRTFYRVDPNTWKVSAFELRALPPGNRHRTGMIHRDRTGMLWLAGSYGLMRFDPATGSSILHPQIPPRGTPSGIKTFAEDASGKFWLATFGGDPDFFDPAAGSFARRWREEKRGGAIAGHNAVVVGRDGVVWMGSPASGLEVFDPATGALGWLRHNPADRHSLSGNEIECLMLDRGGNLWVGTKGGGVDVFAPETLRFGAWRPTPGDPRSLSDSNVRSIYRDRSGVLWVGSYDGGLNRLDDVSGSFTHFRHDPRNPASLDSDRIYTIYEDRAGLLWAGTALGLNRLDRRSGAFTRFVRGDMDTLEANLPTYSILEDRRGGFWFGAGEYVGLLDRRTGVVERVAPTGGLSMLETRAGILWFASAHGLTRRDPSGTSRRIPMQAPDGHGVQINFMHEAADGMLWFAAEVGLFRFDPRTEQFTSYAKQEGLPDNVVQCILPGEDGELWLSTNNGLSRFQPRDGSFINYQESEGLQGAQFNRKACFVDSAGVLYFGGLHGFNIFDPKRIPARPSDTGRVVLTELRIGGRAIAVGPGSVLRQPIWESKALEFPYSDNGLTLEFTALSYRDQANIRYRFKMENLEDQWTEADSRNRSARYTGMPPGRYRFRAQASRDGTVWSAEEASVAISIAPPWWMTWWSRGAAVLLTIGLLAGVYRARIGVLRRQRRKLEKLVEQRTAELLEAKEQSEKARVEAERANRAKSVFLANMSHELRTPLNAILGFSNLLHERSSSDDQRRDLEIINRSGDHLLTLINGVLDVAKIEAGRMTLEVAVCDLSGIVRDVSEMMRARAAEKGVTLAVENHRESPQHIRADGARLREVLINLVGNAVKFTHEGSVTLRVATESSGAQDAVVLRFEVEDTGIGIAPEDRERIFEPFEQVATNLRQKGTGLGLAITREVVGLMGGRIELKSEVGRGSCFRVWIPAQLATKAEAPVTATRGRVVGLEEGQPEYRILVVEDEPQNWMVLERLLREAGFVVRVAESGEQGVECFREWRPQFIWMDLRMSGMDGVEATRQIRGLEGGADVKIAALTASGFDSRRQEVLAKGLDDYLRKPFRPEAIFDCMARHLGVRYRWSGTATSAQPSTALPREAVAALPVALRRELQDAIVGLNGDRIRKIVGQISELDPALGRALVQSTEKFAYSAVLRALDGAGERS
jgi:signal transduction histidine kinase/ligand-binding sensor domain-containing protein/CheY-like chemotaxis protein